MSKMNFTKPLLLLIALFFVHSAIAQSAGTVRALVNKTTIMIGEPLELIVEANIPADASIRFPAIDSIAHFEFLPGSKVDTSNTAGGTRIKGVYSITSFDSGRWVIPPFSVSATLQSDSIPIDVVFADFNPDQPYHDIKDVLDVKPEQDKKDWWWYAAGGAILLVVLLILLTRKKKQVQPVAAKVSVNPYLEAMQQLEQLNKEKPEVKQFHSRLADIFRLYVFRQKGILSMQKTTDDLIIQLKGVDLPKQEFDTLSQTLRLGDFVKFAKFVPTEDDTRNCFGVISNTIQLIEKTITEPLSSGKSDA